MIFLDTNVLSELARRAPDAGVVTWLDALDASQVGTTAICVAELLYGVARLPAGRRKTRLGEAIRGLLDEEFGPRVAPFDETAATFYAAIVTRREKAGRPVSIADAQIAAICLAHDATLASRKVKDFEMTGVTVVDPWQPR